MRPIELLGQPLVLVRGDDGVLRAFHNICPYDGCLAVRSEQQAAKAIEVYYHRWRYHLPGCLLAASYWDGTPGGDPSCLDGRGDLVEIRSGTRLGLLRLVDSGRFEVNSKPGPGRTRHLLQCSGRWVLPSALQPCDHRLSRRHACSQLGLSQLRLRARLDE